MQVLFSFVSYAKYHSLLTTTNTSSLANNTALGFVHAIVIMAALRSRCGHYIFALFLLPSCFVFSLPNLSGRRGDAYHTSSHDVALV